MDLSRIGKNLLFALLLLLIVGSIDEAGLPFTQRVEEYIAFVLTTDFDYQNWIERTQGLDFLREDAGWRRWIPWLAERSSELATPVEESLKSGR